MPEQIWENEFESFDRWHPETAEVLDGLLRALRRKKGFGLFFVQCNLTQAKRTMEAIQDRFPQKRLVQFELNRQSQTLYGGILARYQGEKFEIACVTGVEQALYGYEEKKRCAGWSVEEIYCYRTKGKERQPLLSHLNRQREVFETNLPIALVFLVPSFAIDYFTRHAPNFFDWRSGFFKFPERILEDFLKSFYPTLIGKSDREYITLTSEQRMEQILAISKQIDHLKSSNYKQESNLLREQGQLFESDGDSSRALDCYDRALTKNPANYKAWHSKGSILDEFEKYEEAIKSYDSALKINPDHHYSWHERGRTLSKLKRYEEAIKSYDRALEIKPDSHYSWYHRGNAFFDLKQYEKAIESYDLFLEVEPDAYYLWMIRGDVLRLERYEEAIESYDRVLEIKPNYHHAWRGKGATLYQLGKYEEASDCFAKVAEIQPSDSRAWSNQGYLALAQYSHGLQPIWEKPLLIRLFQDCSGLQNSTAIDLERCQKALDLFDMALKIDPKFALFWANFSFPAYYLQQYQVARQNCDKALKINLDNEKEINEIIYTNRGCIFLQLYNPTAALQDFTKALEIDPKLDEAWLGHGTALYQLERYPEALESFTQALNLNHPLAKKNINLTRQHLEL